MAEEFRLAGLKFEEQKKYDIIYNDKKIGTSYMDFLVEEKVVIELKRGQFSYFDEIEQTLQYLKMSGLKLGLIIRFTHVGVRYKRVLNLY